MKKTLCAFILLLLSGIAYGQNDGSYFTTSDGVKLYVRVAGSGRPCLFLHGGPGLTSYIFEATPAAKLIEKKMRMIYFDQRGSGRSGSSKTGDYSIKRMEKDIEEIRAYFKIKKWAVMAHSFGGEIETAYGKDYQQYIYCMVYLHCGLNVKTVLQSHIVNGTRLLHDIGDNYEPDTKLSAFDQMMKVHEEMAKKGIEYKIMFRSQHEKNIEDSLIKASTPHFNQDFQHHIWKMKEYQVNFGDYTKDIKCPVLIITGTKDYAVGPDAYKDWRFPNKKIVFYDGAHTSYQEEPRWFADKVLPFLESEQ